MLHISGMAPFFESTNSVSFKRTELYICCMWRTKYLARFGLFVGLIHATSGLKAQHYHQPFSQQEQLRLEREMTKPGLGYFTSVKPYRVSALNPLFSPDSVLSVRAPKGRFARTWVGRKLFSEHLVQVYTPNFSLEVDPAFDFSVGRVFGDRNTWFNTRGVQLRGNLGKHISFGSEFYENQAALPDYVAGFADSAKIVPGMGRTKSFKESAYDFAFAFGLNAKETNEGVFPRKKQQIAAVFGLDFGH